MSANEGIDRRRHPRFDLLAQVRVKRSQSDLLTELSNISLSGALIDLGTLAAPSWIDVDRVIEMSIVHPETLDSIDVDARIVRFIKDQSGTRLAVEFVDVSDAAQSALEALIAFASVRPGPPPLPKS